MNLDKFGNSLDVKFLNIIFLQNSVFRICDYGHLEPLYVVNPSRADLLLTPLWWASFTSNSQTNCYHFKILNIFLMACRLYSFVFRMDSFEIWPLFYIYFNILLHTLIICLTLLRLDNVFTAIFAVVPTEVLLLWTDWWLSLLVRTMNLFKAM